jgi:hypothetical protein
MAFCEGPPALYHVHFDPPTPGPALTSATEFLRVYFPVDYSEADQKSFHEGMLTFGKIVKDNWQGCKDTRGGWAKEEVENPKSGEKSRLYVAVIGWENVQSHMDFRETSHFKDNVHYLRGAKDLQHVEMTHVDAKKWTE